jgi:hypothetical protein
MIWMNGARTVCGSHTSHTLMKAPNYGKNWRRKLQGRTQQNAHEIKLKKIATGGGKWQRHWSKNLGADGGGGRFKKPSTTTSVLNGVSGGGKWGR